MKRFLFVGLTAVFLVQPFYLSAQIYNSTPGNTEFLNFLGGSGQNSTWGPQVGPYTASFASDPSNPFSIYCVDYLHYATSQDVNVTSLASGSILGNTRLNDLAKYRRAAYLSSLFDSWTDYSEVVAGSPDLSRKTVWSGLHAAIWNTMSGQPTVSGVTLDVSNYFTGLATPGQFSTDGWYVLTGTDLGTASYDGTGQEFLMRANSVPGPSTYLLLGTGMLFLVLVGWKRSKGLTNEA